MYSDNAESQNRVGEFLAANGLAREDLAQLEREHQFWLSTIPPELSDTSKATTVTTKIYSIYLHLWDLEFQFFLHHPVLINKHYNTAALKKCL